MTFGIGGRVVLSAAMGAAMLGALAATPALAQGTVAQRQGCEGDAFKFCSQYIPWVHQIENCLYKNMKKLTPACQVQMRGGK